MLLLFYFNELHQKIKNILIVKKTSNYRLFVNEKGTKALLYTGLFYKAPFSILSEAVSTNERIRNA